MIYQTAKNETFLIYLMKMAELWKCCPIYRTAGSQSTIQFFAIFVMHFFIAYFYDNFMAPGIIDHADFKSDIQNFPPPYVSITLTLAFTLQLWLHMYAWNCYTLFSLEKCNLLLPKGEYDLLWWKLFTFIFMIEILVNFSQWLSPNYKIIAE